MVIYCSKCGQENPDDAKYCSKCGALIKDYGKDEVKPVEKKIEVKEQTNKSSNRKKFIWIISILIFLFIVFLLVNRLTYKGNDTLKGDIITTTKYDINNKGYNTIVELCSSDFSFCANSFKFIDNDKIKFYTWFNEDEKYYLKITIRETCVNPNGVGFLEDCDFENKKSDIIYYEVKRIGNSNEIKINQVNIEGSKKELNIVSSVHWIKENE
jgi:hypothetical protein